MAHKKQRGNSWWYVVKRKILPKPITLTFSIEAEGDEYVRQLEALLDKGIVPAEFAEKMVVRNSVGDLLREARRVSSLLSYEFGLVFDLSGCYDLRFHDLRHEATSRLFERTNLSDLEIAKITGHKDPRMLMRYANLRASTLAERLW